MVVTPLSVLPVKERDAHDEAVRVSRGNYGKAAILPWLQDASDGS